MLFAGVQRLFCLLIMFGAFRVGKSRMTQRLVRGGIFRFSVSTTAQLTGVWFSQTFLLKYKTSSVNSA